ncbi:cytochrome P450 [Sinosporangium siamense]|uniref:Cytochrome P450 n=1 Tax=Sinosporangium siamense TaxID=1367973 RepID=A0A919RP94_9ACTN|nr:cytochrome P450 [Sinosporangium siamense]GII97348.1 cytochrome P450 [Sinosporangium siamense]
MTTPGAPAPAPLPTTFPMARPPGCPFDPPEELARLRGERPITPMTYPDGHVGWLVTSHTLARAVLADRRFSRRPDLTHNPIIKIDDRKPAPPGAFNAMDPPEHTHYRHLLTGQFTVRRMRRLTGRLEEITADRLDAMERHGPPVDLVEAYTLPVPALMICELLGVPREVQEPFQRNMSLVLNLKTDRARAAAAVGELMESMLGLVSAKRAHPTDDLLGGLVTDTDLSDAELTTIATVLVGAGFETTANMLALGVFALMRHPDRISRLRAGGDSTAKAVEELLRYLSIIPATVRTALEDLELGGVTVKAGQTVTLSLPAANRDPLQFADPDTLDLTRPATGHVAFGHGIHQCLGQQLARVEMQVGSRPCSRDSRHCASPYPPRRCRCATTCSSTACTGCPSPGTDAPAVTPVFCVPHDGTRRNRP